MKLQHRATDQIIAVDKDGQRVLFLDPQDLSVLHAIEGLPSRPHELLVVQAHRKAYVPIYGDGIHGDNPHPNHLVAIIDLDQRSLRGVIDIAPVEAPHTLRLGRNGLVYLCCENSAVVLVIDPASDAVVGRIDVPSTNIHRLAPLAHADEVYTEGEEDGLVSVIELQGQGGAVVKNITMPGPTNGVDASPLRPWVVATSADGPQMHVIDTETRAVVRTVPLTGHEKKGQVVRFSPDGSIMAIIGDFEPVVSFYDSHLDFVFKAALGDKPLDGCFSPDLRYFLCANENDATVSVIDLTERRTLGHVPVGKGCEILAYFER